MNDSFEYITFLQFRVKTLQNTVNDLKSGATYVKMCKKQQQRVRYYENLIKWLKKELKLVKRTITRNKEQWYEVLRTWKKKRNPCALTTKED